MCEAAGEGDCMQSAFLCMYHIRALLLYMTLPGGVNIDTDCVFSTWQSILLLVKA